jgi:cell division inhibitor SepF
MASFWQKTLFHLGLTDEDAPEPEAEEQSVAQSGVRTVDPDAGVPSPEQPASPGREPISPEPAPRPGVVAGRRVEPPTRSRRRISGTREHAEAGLLLHHGDPGAIAAHPATEVIQARAFSDAQRLADLIRLGNMVVLDLRSTEPEMVRRLVDFSSGLTYALDGTMRKIGQGVILVAPAGAGLDEEERDRLAALGLYQAPDRA